MHNSHRRGVPKDHAQSSQQGKSISAEDRTCDLVLLATGPGPCGFNTPPEGIPAEDVELPREKQRARTELDSYSC